MSHLTKNERESIEFHKNLGLGPTGIGTILGRNKSVISREIKLNSTNGYYCSKKAHHKAYLRRYWVGTDIGKIKKNRILEKYIEAKLKRRHSLSPEAIAACWNQDFGVKQNLTITGPTIYKYLYKKRPSLCRFLCFKRFKKRKRAKTSKREMITNRIGIEKRPAIVDQKTRIGDWEGDTIVSIKGDKTALLVVHDRASRFICVSKTKDITKKRIIPKIKKLLKNKPQHSLTVDNGIEFKGHKHFGIDTFFCNPYSSWEKGAVEYSNRLLRRPFPKKYVLANISPKELSLVVEAINNTPRKCLNWKTPAQVFYSQQLLL